MFGPFFFSIILSAIPTLSVLGNILQMLHLFIQSSDEKHFPRQVSFVIDLLRNIQSNTGHTKASNMSWHPILGYCVSSPGTVRDPRT